MKLLRLVSTFLLVSLLATACSSESMFDEQRTFEGSVWNAFKPEKFEVGIDNVDDYYDLYATITVDTSRLHISPLPIIVNINSENGERRTFQSYIMLKKQDGTYNGTINGRYLTCEQKFREYFSFNQKGNYTIEIVQGTTRYDLEGVETLRLSVRKAKLVYPE